MTKQEIIEQTFGEHFKNLKDIDENGWVTARFKDDGNMENGPLENGFPFGTYEGDKRGNIGRTIYWRPIKLKGIELNNGWIKVEESLPDKEGAYEVCKDGDHLPFPHIFIKKPTEATLSDFAKQYSHWMPTPIIPNPLY